MFWFYVGSKKSSVHTRISHGTKEYGPGLLSQVRQQMRLETASEFDRFMDCPMDEAEYRDLLIARGHVAVGS